MVNPFELLEKTREKPTFLERLIQIIVIALILAFIACAVIGFIHLMEIWKQKPVISQTISPETLMKKNEEILELRKDLKMSQIRNTNLKTVLVLLYTNHAKIYRPVTDSLVLYTMSNYQPEIDYWFRRIKEEKELIYDAAIDQKKLEYLRQQETKK